MHIHNSHLIHIYFKTNSTLKKIFKKGNNALNKERYDKETVPMLIGRDQVHYFELLIPIWNQFKPCELNISGTVTPTLKFLEDKSERPFRVDLQSTTTDVLFQAIKEYAKEFGKKSSALDPGDFEFYLSPVSAYAAMESGGGQTLIPILPFAPMWLYSLRKEDILILVHKESGSSAAGAGLAPGDDKVTVKLVLAESNAATTFLLPRGMLVRDMLEFVNNYKWNSLGISYRKLEAENAKYYGLYYLSSNQGMVLLDDEGTATIGDYSNLKLFIVTLKRKKICELELQCVAGNVPKDLLKKVNEAKNTKLLLSLDYSLREAEAFVLDWFNKT